MPAEKSYLNVATIPYEDGRIYLKITLRHKATEAFIGCYRMAFYRRGTGFIGLRASGAPTVSTVDFEGNCAITPLFANNPTTLAEAKTFLSEFDTVLRYAEELYEAELTKKAQEREQEIREAGEQLATLENLNDFFNN